MTVEMILGILGVIAGLMHVSGFVLYYKQTLRKISNPNGATWSLWFAISLLNCISFIRMSKDMLVGFLPIASTFSCMIVAGIFFCKGKLSKLDFWDNIALVFGMISVFVWQYYDSPTYGNLLLQSCIVISFIPTYRGVIKDKDTEKKALVWFIWASAYILQIILVCLRWETWYQLVYPINCLLLHSGIGILSLRKPKIKTRKEVFEMKMREDEVTEQFLAKIVDLTDEEKKIARVYFDLPTAGKSTKNWVENLKSGRAQKFDELLDSMLKKVYIALGWRNQ